MGKITSVIKSVFICVANVGIITIVSPLSPFVNFSIKATNYEVGPQKPYEAIGGVPWNTLDPGDSVLIYHKDTPYKEKWVICNKGDANNPIVISGVPNNQGELPIIDGNEAVTDTQFNFWNEERGLIKIGGSNSPPDTMPEYIIVQNLDIKSAREGYTFTGRYGITNYFKNAAAVYIEKGEHITIKNCILHDCGNGFFSASQSTDILVEACYYYDNGFEESIYEHNNYSESKGITFQFNRFGPLRESCLGNNLKDRSSGCVIRYNWIEGGNRQLDLVHSDYPHIVNDPAYATTFVYGNILIEPDNAGNSQICHYGGDDDDSLHNYRKGTLYFYHNTVVSTRTGNTTLLRLSSDDETADIRNNVAYVTEPGTSLAISNSSGTANLQGNWLKTGWKGSHSNPQADVNDLGNNVVENEPGFTNFSGQDFSLKEASNCINKAGSLAQQCLPDHLVTLEYLKHRKYQNRFVDSIPDIGAFENNPGINIFIDDLKPNILYGKTWNYPNPFTNQTSIYYCAPNREDAIIKIYDCRGRTVRTIIIYNLLSNKVVWDGKDGFNTIVTGGLYYYHIFIGSKVLKGNMIFTKL